jgi:hypothetical protein
MKLRKLELDKEVGLKSSMFKNDESTWEIWGNYFSIVQIALIIGFDKHEESDGIITYTNNDNDYKFIGHIIDNSYDNLYVEDED